MIEDPYHVAMECPLYERARVELYTKLQSTDSDFSSATTLGDLHMALMNAGHPNTVKSVGRYLADCMAIRDTYNNQAAKSHWITTINKTFARTCANEKLTACDKSLDILKTLGCDVTVTLCKPVAAHLP